VRSESETSCFATRSASVGSACGAAGVMMLLVVAMIIVLCC